MQFALFGTLEVRDDGGRVVDLGGPQPRTVLAMLLAARGRVVSAGALIDALWGESPPASAAGTLQSYVSRLRSALEPDRRPRDEARVLVSVPPGYRLEVDPDDIDFVRFERLADEARAALAEGRHEDAVATMREAEALWQGPAFADFADAEFARGLATRLDERRLAMVEQRLEAELTMGRAAEVAAESAEAVRAEPLREGLWAIHALALYRAGRQADALRAIDTARRTLVEELGVELGRDLKDLESDILAQADRLQATPRPSARPATPRVRSRTPRATPDAGLVGRSFEMDSLRDAIDEAADAARFVVVEGEPGIGKTRLAEALAAEAEAAGSIVVWGRTHESGAAPAYWPWLGALRALAQQRPDVAEDLEPLLDPSEGTGPQAEAGPASFRLFETVATALETVAATEEEPLVLLLDDLQWADPASLELLSFLTTRITDVPLLVAVTVRTLEVGRSAEVVSALSSIARRPGSRRLRLHGLDPEDNRALLAAIAGREVDPEVAAAIHARSGGNPFFGSELARLLASDDLLDDADAVLRARVPAGVRDVLRRRLDRLPETTVELLQVAAVLGRDLELPLVAGASGRSAEECLDALEPAVAQHLLVDAEMPAVARFAHALVREVLVEDMTGVRRARLHLRAADALEQHGGQGDGAELVAEHLWAAVSLGVGERAAAALERAAEVAVRRAAFATAEDLLRRALELRRSAGSGQAQAATELSTLMALASVSRSLHGYLSIFDLVDRGKELARQLDSRELYMNLEWAEWAAADTSCDFERSRPIAERFRAMAEEANPDELARRMLGAGVWGIHCWHHGRLTEAKQWLDESREAAGQLPPHEIVIGLVAEQRFLSEVFQIHMHDVAGDLDDPAAAYDSLLHSQEDRFARAMIASFQTTAALSRGEFDRAGAASRAGLAADPDVAFSFWGSLNLMAVAVVDLMQGGDVDDAVARFETGHERFTGSGARTVVGLYYSTMALALGSAGDLGRAATYLERARRELAERNETWPEPVALLAEADLLARRGGDAAQVRELLERAESLAEEQGAHAVARRMVAEQDRIGSLVS